jgi:predicted ATPase/DNA-binding SARP family transcriptional activator
VEYRVLGPIEAVGEDGRSLALGGLRQRAVLGCLLIHANQVVSTDRLIDAVWEDDPPLDPLATLRTYLSRLRKAVGAESLVQKANGYLIRTGPDDLDALVFERLLQEARRAVDSGQPDVAIERLDLALGMWSGDAYADFSYSEFARREIERLDELRTAAIEDRLHLLVETGRAREAVPELEAALDDHPLREGLWASYMTALYREGRQADSLRAFKTASARLGEELGIEPGADLRHLEERILMQDPSLLPTSPAGAAEVSIGEVALLAATASDPTAPWESFDSEVIDHRGRVFRSLPNQHLAVFARIGDAVATAAAIQAGAGEGSPLLGVAIHLTEARPRGDDYVGNGVSRVIRLATAAAPGQTLVTTQAHDEAVGSGSPLPVTRVAELQLPGMSSEEKVFVIAETGTTDSAASEAMANSTNLPSGGLTSFVGRAAEIREVRDLADRHRLVTLTGPGGVGKTRLSQQVAADLVGAYAGGVWLVELAALPPDLILAAILTTVGVDRHGDEDEMQAISRYAADSPLLLVLDNCEHIIDEVAEAVSGLLASSPGVSILATSRERLGIHGEVVYQVPGLAVPATDHAGVDSLKEVESVSLFLDRARLVNARFEFDPDTAPAVSTLCRRLDGMPLALELAASRMNTLTVGEISERLADRFSLLVSRARGLSPRQQTLQSVIDWSYDLLDPDERDLLCRLSVFHGWYDLQAAEDIGSGGSLEASQILDILGRLVSKSLVTVDSRAATSRYRMLETIREYAARLVDNPLELTRRHGAHFQRLAQTWSEDTRADTPSWARLGTHIEDVRAALEWVALEQPEDLANFVCDLQRYWLLTTQFREGMTWTARAIGEVADGELRAKLAQGGGPLAAENQRPDLAESWLRDALDYATSIDDRAGMAVNLANLAGLTISALGRPTEALEMLDRSMEILHSIDDSSPRARERLSASLRFRAGILYQLGRLAEAEELVEESIRLVDSPDRYARFHAFRMLASIALADLRLDDARARLESARQEGAELGGALEADTLNGLATVALIEGDLEQAVALLDQAYELLDETASEMVVCLYLRLMTELVSGDPRSAGQRIDPLLRAVRRGTEERMVEAVEAAALCRLAIGQRDQGRALMRAVDRHRARSELVVPGWQARLVEQIAERNEIDLTAAVEGPGPAMSLPEAVDLAMRG